MSHCSDGFPDGVTLLEEELSDDVDLLAAEIYDGTDFPEEYTNNGLVRNDKVIA